MQLVQLHACALAVCDVSPGGCRPRETGFPGATTGQNELFASPEVSQRVSAELLLRRVRVARRSMGADVADITGDAAFCCMFSYDPVAYTLGLLPASEL